MCFTHHSGKPSHPQRRRRLCGRRLCQAAWRLGHRPPRPCRAGSPLAMSSHALPAPSERARASCRNHRTRERQAAPRRDSVGRCQPQVQLPTAPADLCVAAPRPMHREGRTARTAIRREARRAQAVPCSARTCTRSPSCRGSPRDAAPSPRTIPRKPRSPPRRAQSGATHAAATCAHGKRRPLSGRTWVVCGG